MLQIQLAIIVVSVAGAILWAIASYKVRKIESEILREMAEALNRVEEKLNKL